MLRRMGTGTPHKAQENPGLNHGQKRMAKPGSHFTTQSIYLLDDFLSLRNFKVKGS